ncbi:MAG: HAMP domain-containing histidine kinase [Myxococcales bacterium]|nr:HAMP domain-containing histidine kinase [Myxococcales bacterium]
MIRAPRRIWFKLALAYVLPTALLFGALSWLGYRAAATELEAELGRRLEGLALAASVHVPESITRVVPGDEQAEFPFVVTRARLEAVRARTGAARLFIFTPDFTARCDTAGAAIGTRLAQLEVDRHELTRLFAGRVAVSSTLFRGSDGAWHKVGYAPLPDGDGAIGVEAPAGYFARLDALVGALRLAGLVIVGLALLIALAVAALIARPIERLAAAAERIGRGDLTAIVPVRGRDEIGVLARTLDEMREALRQRSERLEMMLAGIAHEVRNPLGGIKLFAGILREDLSADAERLSHVTRIEREVGRLDAVVGDFLDYARRPAPALAPVELAPLFAEVAELLGPDAAVAGVTLVTTTADAACVNADAGQLRRVLLNLAKNALEATPAGGRVELCAGPGPRLTVSDNGRGIPEAERERVFTPFFTTREKGTGLGLAFVREIVLDHGGAVTLAEASGGGTVVTVELTAGPSSPAPEHAAQ